MGDYSKVNRGIKWMKKAACLKNRQDGRIVQILYICAFLPKKKKALQSRADVKCRCSVLTNAGMMDLLFFAAFQHFKQNVTVKRA